MKRLPLSFFIAWRCCLLPLAVVPITSCSRPHLPQVTNPVAETPTASGTESPMASSSPNASAWTDYIGATYTVKFPVGDGPPKARGNEVRIHVRDRYYDVNAPGELDPYTLSEFKKDPAAALKKTYGRGATASESLTLPDGSPAFQVSRPGNIAPFKAVYRWVYANNRVYKLEVQGLTVSETDSVVTAFLDSFKPKK